jgi:hypothetical protein
MARANSGSYDFHRLLASVKAAATTERPRPSLEELHQ